MLLLGNKRTTIIAWLIVYGELMALATDQCGVEGPSDILLGAF